MVGFKNKETPFVFPEPVPLTMTLSDIFKGHCTRKIGYTICVGGRGKKPEDKRNWSAYYVDGKILQLTSKEGKQLMGFPDWFEFPVSETQGMKQLGNSVAVNAVEAVAKEIIKALSLVKK
jgi:DNA (cytosine-5)-methyltransferase 1